MRGAKRARGDDGGAGAGEAGHTMHARGLEGEGHRRQDGGQQARQHRLPHARWTEEEDIMVTTPASASRSPRRPRRPETMRALVRGAGVMPSPPPYW
jgi:hypothetical protein